MLTPLLVKRGAKQGHINKLLQNMHYLFACNIFAGFIFSMKSAYKLLRLKYF